MTVMMIMLATDGRRKVKGLRQSVAAAVTTEIMIVG